MQFSNLRLQLAEKTLTPAEKKKREEIAQAIKRENPSMPIAKKMAIATAQAKKVAENVEQIEEWTYVPFKDTSNSDNKKSTTVGTTHYGKDKLKGANIMKHTNGKYYAAGGSSTAATSKTTFHDTPEKAAAAYHEKYAKTMKEEVSLDEASTGKGNHRPGWMLRADPKLAQKFKEKREAYKARVKAYGNPAAGKSVKEETEQIEEMDKSQTPPGRDGGHQFPPGPNVSKKVKQAVKKDPAKHLSDLFDKEYAKKKPEQGVAEGSGEKVHLKTPKHGLADHPGRNTGVGLRTFAQTPKQDRCPKCNSLFKNHYKQGVAEGIVTELSKKILGSYVKAAAQDAEQAGRDQEYHGHKNDYARGEKRQKGIEKAVNRLTKEQVDQIDELKKSTVTSYINKVVDPVYGIPKGGKETVKKRLAGLSRAHQRIVGHKPMTKEEVEQVEEAQFWGNKEMAKQANAASGSTTTMRGRDAKGTYTATLERKKGESEHKEVSRKYDTKSESFAQQFTAMVREKRPEAKLTNSIEKRKETEELIKKRQASGVKHSMFVPPHNKYPINSRFD